MTLIWAGLLLIVLHGLGIEPVAGWPLPLVVAPFALALIWLEFIEPALLRAARRRRGLCAAIVAVLRAGRARRDPAADEWRR